MLHKGITLGLIWFRSERAHDFELLDYLLLRVIRLQVAIYKLDNKLAQGALVLSPSRTRETKEKADS